MQHTLGWTGWAEATGSLTKRAKNLSYHILGTIELEEELDKWSVWDEAPSKRGMFFVILIPFVLLLSLLPLLILHLVVVVYFFYFLLYTTP